MSDNRKPLDEQDETPLEPIPEEGTSAPSNSGRVFGRQPAGPTPPSGGFEPQNSPTQNSPTPPSQSPQRQPDEDEARAMRARGRVALIFGLGGLVIGLLFGPAGVVFGLLLSLAGGVLGVIAVIRGRRLGVRVPGAAPAIVVGSLALVVSLMLGAVAAVFWDELQRYSTCSSSANTQISQEQCVDQFSRDLERRGVQLPGQLPGQP